MKYDAFISYRHAPLDMEIAKKLHKALETYHIPASVQKKTGKKRINRVFRDQEELPIGSDLNDNISSALKEAEYLIVICSKDTPESYWVLKEIETFISMHDREHVLAILIDGEPREAFPAPLLVDDNGNPVEPLAADIRANSASERNNKFKSEFLRIAAPVIGCTYDDLKQRHKERIIKRNLAIGFAAVGCLAVFGTIFGVYNAVTASKMKKLAEEKAELANEKTILAGEIQQELTEKQINQSRFYAQKSEALLNAGKREDAALVALAGLPSEDEPRPLVSEAVYALGNALNAYALGDKLCFDKILEHDFNVSATFMNEEKNRLTTIDSNGSVFIWDTDSMDQLVKIPAPLDSDGKPEECISANADEKSVYVCYRNRLVKYDYSGNSLSDYSVDFNISACDFHTGSSQAAFCGENKVCVLDLSNLSEIFSVACDTSVYDGFFGDIIYSPDYEFLCVAQSSYGFGNATTLVTFMDTKTGEIANVEVPGEYINNFNITKNGNLAVLYSEGIYRGDIENAKFLGVYSKDGKNLWTEKLAANYHVFQIAYELLDSASFTKEDTEYNLIVASTQYDTFTYDEFTGELITAFSHPAPICSQYVSRARTTGYLLFLDGSITIVDFTTGQYYSEYEFRCNFSPNMMQVGTRQDILTMFVCEADSPNVYGLSFFTAPDLTEFVPNPEQYYYTGTEPRGNYFIIEDFHTDHKEYYDSEGNLLYSDDVEYSSMSPAFFDNIEVVPCTDKLIYVDPYNKTQEELTYAELVKDEEDVFSTNFTAHFLTDQSMGAFYGSKSAFVIDFKEKKLKAGYHYNDYVKDAMCSPDGKTLFVIFEDSLKIIDITTGNEKDISSLNLIPNEKSSVNAPSIACSNDGRYFSFFCKDSIIRVIDTADYSVKAELPCYSTFIPATFFSGDNHTFIFQGSDNIIYFYNLENGEFTNLLRVDNTIKHVIYDDEENLISLATYNTNYLFGTSDYGLLAVIGDAATFLTDRNVFLVFQNGMIYQIKYKNYEELIAEEKRQFPDAELTPQKKVNYNID